MSQKRTFKPLPIAISSDDQAKVCLGRSNKYFRILQLRDSSLGQGEKSIYALHFAFPDQFEYPFTDPKQAHEILNNCDLSNESDLCFDRNGQPLAATQQKLKNINIQVIER